MSLSNEAIKIILGIKEHTYITPEQMSKHLKVTFFPAKHKASKHVTDFIKKLRRSLRFWKVRIIPYEKSLKIGKDGKIKNKIKEKIVIITTDIKEGNIPINYVSSATKNEIITVIDKPFIKKLSYEDHLERVTKLFAWHMSNVIISVDKETWSIYNFNGSYPTYRFDNEFNKNVLIALISKVATPIRPLPLSEFIIRKAKGLNLKRSVQKDFQKGSGLLNSTKLFPSVIELNKLKFRNEFHKLIASLYLDRRSGLSYGFLARQLPSKLPKAIPLSDLDKKIINKFINKDFCIYKNKVYVVINIKRHKLVICIPPVWVVITRSGCDKTHLDINKDLIKLGLSNGKMIMVIPKTKTSLDDSKPSFDTRVILAHAVANVIYGAILKYFNPVAYFSKILEKKGAAIIHWHGYMNKRLIPFGWWVYGRRNPAVSCSSPHTAIYAFRGKHWATKESLLSKKEYLGDIHIEPQHGINVIWDSIVGLANFLLSNPKISELGNRYE